MPQKKKITAAELQNIIQAQKQQLEAQEKVIGMSWRPVDVDVDVDEFFFPWLSETLREKKASRINEISKPKGQCGRANSGHGGYSLEKSMGLETKHYNRIQVMSFTLTISAFHANEKYHFSALLNLWDISSWTQIRPTGSKTRLSFVESKPL